MTSEVVVLMGEKLPAARAARAALPEIARHVTEIVVDNPLQVGIIFSGAFLAPRVAIRLVRPRTLFEAAALGFLVTFGVQYTVAKLSAPGGLLELKLRDRDADSPDSAA